MPFATTEPTDDYLAGWLDGNRAATVGSLDLNRLDEYVRDIEKAAEVNLGYDHACHDLATDFAEFVQSLRNMSISLPQGVSA